jgi:hypothetical protein
MVYPLKKSVIFPHQLSCTKHGMCSRFHFFQASKRNFGFYIRLNAGNIKFIASSNIMTLFWIGKNGKKKRRFDGHV